MAAYDLNVQRPASLSVPNSPGANDLARFLSVSESARANQEKEKLSQNMFDWEKGAGKRALTAAESERERVRQENMAMGKYSTDSASGYLSDAKEGFRLEADTLKQFDTAYPNATPEQRDGMRQRTREKITQTPGAFVDQKTMRFDLENQFVNEYGLDRTKAASEAERIMAANFTAPKAPNENVMKAYLDTALNGGVGSMIAKYNPNGENGQGSYGTKGSSGYRSEAEFVKEVQTGVDSQFEEGSRGLSINFPGSNHEIYKDELRAAGLLAQTQQGIKPQYFNSVVLGMSQNGKLPNGQDTKDLKNSKSELFQTITTNARILQDQAEGRGRNGRNGGLSLSQLGEISQNDMNMRFETIGKVGELYRQQGGVLTSDEQYQLMNDPALLEEFGLLLQESVPKQQGGGNPSPAASVPAPVPVPEASANNPAPAPEVTVDDIEDPDPIANALGEGGNRPGQGTSPESGTKQTGNSLEAQLAGMATSSESELLQNQKMAIEEQLSNTPSGNDSTKLFAELNTIDDKQDDNYVKSTKESVSLMTAGYLKNAIPDQEYRSRAQSIVNRIKSGSASDNEVLELRTIFKKFGRADKTSQLMLPGNTPAPSRQETGPTGNGLSLAEMSYEPNQSEIYSQANGSEQIELNRSMLKSNFPNQFL